MRLGTGPRLLSRPELSTYDARLPFGRRHLSASLVCLHDLLLAAAGLGIRFYRLAPQIVPVLSAEDLPGFWAQLEQCQDLARRVGQEASAAGMRLSLHPVLDVQLGSSDAGIAERGAAVVVAWAALLDCLEMGAETRVVAHIGGGGDGRAKERFAGRAAALPETALRRLAIENDERHGRLEDALWLHRRLGTAMVWDYLHWRCLNASGEGASEAYLAATATWPARVRPKLHFSSPSTARRTGCARDRLPACREHADFIDPFAFLDFHALVGADCDVMLEGRGKELALLKLRGDLAGLGCGHLEEGDATPLRLSA